MFIKHILCRLRLRSVFQCNDCDYTTEEEAMKIHHENTHGHYDWSYMHYIN
ncbi:hypothetical protein GGH92_010194 [Coemansia sp. RSA 2673]|nr:hypothetical protein GGH92_010194 [Coemansia sp. RSA 2673]